MKPYNDFCLYCTGKDINEIIKCNDKYCVFHSFRFGGLEPDIEKDIREKFIKQDE